MELVVSSVSVRKPGARFTKYLTTILRLSYDNAEVTIRSTYDGRLIYNVRKSAYDIPKINLSMF